jgi:hypothetical protein
MGRVTANEWGVVAILEHDDIAKFSTELSAGRDISLAVAALAGAPAPAVAVIALYIRVELELIKRLDVGNGVYLTLPWAAVYFSNPFLIIPTSRPTNIGPGPNWVAASNVQFKTEDAADLIDYRIELNAVSPAVVEFALESGNPAMWRKVLVMPDGLGSQWDITIDPSQGVSHAQNDLWADQVRNGQRLEFWKAKAMGVNSWVLDLDVCCVD